MIVAIGVLIYCKYKKSSDVIEKKIQEDGITGNDYELSHDVTGKPLDSKLEPIWANLFLSWFYFTSYFSILNPYQINTLSYYYFYISDP